MSRNRFQFEEAGEADDLREEEQETVYIDEPDPRYRRRSRMRILTFGGIALLLLLIGGFVVYYFYFREKSPQNMSDLDRRLAAVDLDGLKDRYFLPEGAYSAPLIRAIGYYKSNDRQRAKIELDNFVNSSAPDTEKSVALTYLGVMSMETENFAVAKNYLIRALRYDDKSAAVYVNLAILERKQSNYAEARQYAQKAKELAPNDPRVAVLLGNILADSQDLSGAIDAFREGAENSPADPTLYYNLALSLLRKQQYDEAALYFNKVIDLDKNGAMAVRSYAQLGQIYYSKGNLEMAADKLRKAVEFAPGNGKYLYNLGIVYLRMHENGQAINFFKKSLEAGTNEPVVLRSLSDAFVELKENQMAIQALKKALFINPDDVLSLFQLGDLFVEEKDYLNAADVFRKIVNVTPGDANTIEALLKLGTIFAELERFNDAQNALIKVTELDPQNREARYRLGFVYQKAGRMDQAIRVWKEVLGRGGPTGLDRNEERRIRLALAGLYKKEGAYDLAMNEFRMIESRNKENPPVEEDPELQIEIGKTYLALKDYRNAIAPFKSVVDSRRATPQQRKEAHMNLAVAYSGTGDEKDYESARASANQAARLDPNDENARLIQAATLIKSDSMLDREKAIEILTAVTASDIDSVTSSKAYNLLGLAYYKNGEFSRALHAFDYAVQLDPSNREAYQNQRAAANAYEKSLDR